MALTTVTMEVTFEQRFQKILEFITQFSLPSVLTTPKVPWFRKASVVAQVHGVTFMDLHGTASCCFKFNGLKKPLSVVCRSHVRERKYVVEPQNALKSRSWNDRCHFYSLFSDQSISLGETQ